MRMVAFKRVVAAAAAASSIGVGGIARAQTVPTGQLLPDEANTTQIFQKVSPAVVNISALQEARTPFTTTIEEVPAGTGTGWVFDRQGHIVTNFHVAQNASRLMVAFKNGHSEEARLIGVEPRKDIAVLRVKFPADMKIEPLTLAESSRLAVGQKAVAIGSPFGLEQTLTRGTVSAVGRAIEGIGGVAIRNMVQTDTPINPGNSGGPLLDSAGALIGMNTVIFSRSGTSSGIGFAVPSDTIRRVVGEIIKYGRVQQPGIGISVVPDQTAGQIGVSGVIVLEVVQGGPADQAGLRGTKRTRLGRIALGDVITAIGDDKVESYDDLYGALDKHKIGDEVQITFLRDGKKRNAAVKLTDLQDAQ